MNKLVLILTLIFLNACSSNSSVDGYYLCKGPYKSLDFNNGNVIVDLGFIKKAGTYTVDEQSKTINLTLDGKSLVMKSTLMYGSEKDLAEFEPDDFTILDSPYIKCSNVKVTLETIRKYSKSDIGKKIMEDPVQKNGVEAAIKSLEDALKKATVK
jgi:hypothetical protein